MEDVRLCKLSMSVMSVEKVFAFTALPPKEAMIRSLGFWDRMASMSASTSGEIINNYKNHGISVGIALNS